jgi:cell division protein FtsN
MSLGRDEATLSDGLERPVPPPERVGRERHGRGLPLAIAVITVTIFGGSLWYAYYQGTQDASLDYEPPLARADSGPTKLKPNEPGGMEVPNQDKLVYQRMLTSQPGKSVERLLPPPETPLAKPEAEPATAGSGETTVVTITPTTVVPPKITEKQNPPPKRATTLTIRQTVKPAPAPTVAATTPTKSTKPIPLAPRRFGLQLVSLKKADGATVEWKRLVTAHGAVLAGLSSRVVRADLGEKGVFYRLIAGPFGSDTGARTACRKLRAQKQGCLVVAYD